VFAYVMVAAAPGMRWWFDERESAHALIGCF
jgi:hypothetical protein